MGNKYYIKVTKTWFEKNQGLKSKHNQVNAVELLDGQKVVDMNTAKEFPELFGTSFTCYAIDESQFKKTEL